MWTRYAAMTLVLRMLPELSLPIIPRMVSIVIQLA